METTGPIPNHKSINLILKRAEETRARKLKTKQHRKVLYPIQLIWRGLYFINTYSYFRIFITELIGTFLLNFVADGIYTNLFKNETNLSREALLVWLIAETIAVTFVLYVDLLIFAEYFSPSFNPTISFIYFFLGIINFFEFIWSVIVQFLAAFLQVMFIYYLYDIDHFLKIPTDTTCAFRDLVSEAIGTFFLNLTVMVCIHKTIKPSGPVSFIVGGMILTLPSGMVANPSITFGRMFFGVVLGLSPWSVIFFIIAQFIGTFVAIIVSGFIMFPCITDPYRHRRINELTKRLEGIKLESSEEDFSEDNIPEQIYL
ncbi:hypothetical protein EHI8A_134840 [Entamoeba histolytica HM-1:IMSS-B]|uniref:Aquaporin n=6 Tax=Entamoeba histolytica TaxID=5759 RepID=C4M405_ENTH1|nr:hypothetical protein EHI_195000 [Entamoeba histolytica HM-1:IMSS]EMD42989.1 Hypothetical protein EHI5A_169920 [Entamoeba histolytica KU27]EMH73448.1 hypothetical protein EHI8A_134840 [Entamoeba histolytica HM-1:IMSS-B]EMS15955.1 hypothetical protein KM1_214310 [Entamoeba histolytica HM-3:IMSS]ENY61380.1 hypothetical protein EHI7A_124950 [Entamoeba histolytica HM-1:IMSS-A]GAT96073.1 hypothetical protein CL6EHI_195000 [Entamoeba histolytica]|eukprot:XP_653858.1 hypothetical protein EHI_195000 [Entamoeba histolytica HM-1:IMSS]